MSPELNRELAVRPPFSVTMLRAVTRSAAAICMGTAVGILFESGNDRLGLAVLSPVMGAIATLSFVAEKHLAKRQPHA